MRNISWDIANFNISMKSQYSDIYELENDISNFFGSSNFSEMDSLDWFLINKKTNELSFLLLSVPSFFKASSERHALDVDSLREIKLSECIGSFVSHVTIQDEAVFQSKENILIVASDTSVIVYKTPIKEGLYFLLGCDFSYHGFLLLSATHHIPGETPPSDETISDSLFLRMLDLCNQDFYDAMDEQDERCLSIINQLEKDCLAYQKIDVRLLQTIDFIKNLKYTFYDIDME
ncbi:hypothetical protein [Serratia marcescens]|uniref:hypothetical protein n=1 Tax=Serratia marcescens TaxID=615 RepID=UPI0013DB2495|nr:hypothetical protein [Serratia marcescens]